MDPRLRLHWNTRSELRTLRRQLDELWAFVGRAVEANADAAKALLRERTGRLNAEQVIRRLTDGWCEQRKARLAAEDELCAARREAEALRAQLAEARAALARERLAADCRGGPK